MLRADKKNMEPRMPISILNKSLLFRNDYCKVVVCYPILIIIHVVCAKRHTVSFIHVLNKQECFFFEFTIKALTRESLFLFPCSRKESDSL
jgi:hypothetical protein